MAREKRVKVFTANNYREGVYALLTLPSQPSIRSLISSNLQSPLRVFFECVSLALTAFISNTVAVIIITNININTNINDIIIILILIL